jgi:hypothetical protein
MTCDASTAPRTLATTAGAYVTDGRRLFRVISPLASPPDWETAELEDCVTLETISYTPAQLWAMGLCLVRRSDLEDERAALRHTSNWAVSA